MFPHFCSVCEVFFGFAGHLEFFAGHLIEFNSSSSPDILKIRWTCPASPTNFAYTVSALTPPTHLPLSSLPVSPLPTGASLGVSRAQMYTSQQKTSLIPLPSRPSQYHLFPLALL